MSEIADGCDRLQCSGDQPCKMRAAKNAECVYSALSSDSRRGRAEQAESLKRKIEHLEDQNSKFEQLLLNLRRSSTPEAEEVVSLIRTGASVEQVLHICAESAARATVVPGLDQVRDFLQGSNEASNEEPVASADLAPLLSNPPFD
ncbi:MAG: hypothetical protein Q9159_002090 [Coniocarpon cinnabarinum]